MSADLGGTYRAKEYWKLASFCNRQGSDSRLLLAFRGSEAQWSPLPYEEDKKPYGCTGIAHLGTKYYVLTQSLGAVTGKTGLMVLDHDCRWLRSQMLERVQDGHSLAVHRDQLYAVSTGSNSIYRLVLYA